MDSIRKTKKLLKIKANSNNCNDNYKSNDNLTNNISNSNIELKVNHNFKLNHNHNVNSKANSNLNLNFNPNISPEINFDSNISNPNFLPNKLRFLKNNKINIKPNNNQNNNLNIGLINIRSINSKSIYISDLISYNSLDLFAVTETWHESASSPSLITASPSGFSFVELARPPSNPLSSKHSSYGRVCLFYRSIFSISVDSSSFNFSTFKCLFTSFNINSFKFNLVVVYRPPSSSLSLFLNDFHHLSESLYSLSIPFFILGDFNISFNKVNDSYVLKFF